jgi:acetolactate synthase I/II/III large subunit
MTNQELATCAIEGIPIKVAVINNGNLGMVRQWQTLFYEERYSHTELGTHKHRVPDFVLLAEALGCVGLRCESQDEVDRVIEQAMAIDDRPVVIDFTVGADAQVWPMVAAGTGNDQIMAARNIRPLFDGDELVADAGTVSAVTAEAQRESADWVDETRDEARTDGTGRGGDA